MPTPRQLSINVGVEDSAQIYNNDGGIEKKDVELGELGRRDRPVGKYPFLTTVLNPNNTFLVLLVNRKLLRFPGLKLWAAWFAPVIILSLLAPLPFYVSVTVPNKHIEKYPVSQCTMVSFHESYYDYASVNFVFQVNYTDSNGNLRFASHTHDAADYSQDNNWFIQDYYENIHESGQPFPCYYKGDFVTATKIPHYMVHYSFKEGWYVAGGLTVGWIVIMFIFGACFLCNPIRNDRRTVIYKEIYEEIGNSRMKVDNWGSVGYNMRQPLHAFIYAWLVRENGTIDFPEKKVNITNFELVYFRPRTVVLVLSSVISFLFTIGALALLVAAFFQKNTSVLELYWCLGVIITIIPCFLVVLFLATKARSTFRATAEISGKTESSMTDLTITRGTLSPIAVGNDVLSGAFTSSAI